MEEKVVKQSNLKYIFIEILCFLQFLNISLSCNSKTTKDSTETIWHGNVYYKIVYLSDSTYRINWGNKFVSRISKQTFEVTGAGVFEYSTSNDNVIILRQGCGTSCTFYLVLPITFYSDEKIYGIGLAVDIKNNLIAYFNNDADPPSFIEIENYKTGKKIIVYEDDVCSAEIKIECIDKCYFENNELKINWQGSKWQSFEQPDQKVKCINLNTLLE